VLVPGIARGDPFAAASGGIAFVCLYIAVRLAQRLREANQQAEELLRELARTRDADARAAALAERQRLARDMHDVLAHSLSGLLLQLEGARLLATDGSNDPRLGATIETAHRLAKTGLDEARQAIGILRFEEVPGTERLAALTSRFEHDHNVPCRFAVRGVPVELGPEQSLAIYRVAQEALTNVAKHADASHVEVSLEYRPNRAVLVVEDVGACPAGPNPPSDVGGYGLSGMRERAELLGGTLVTSITKTGFRVELEIPS
jgi:signal transduction histidine kinase